MDAWLLIKAVPKPCWFWNSLDLLIDFYRRNHETILLDVSNRGIYDDPVSWRMYQKTGIHRPRGP
jgi:hypothetical protein